MIWPDPTHKPTHPPTHPWNYTPTHGWGSLHRFQIFKQNWNISISSSAIEFWLIPGVPHPGGWGVGGWGWGVVTGSPHTCAYARARTYVHAHTRTYDIIGNPWDFPKSNGGSHLHGIIMFTTHACACVCVRACACMCTCVGGTPQPPPIPIHPAPQPQSRREPKTPKFNKSWTNRDNSILFEDSLPLNIPQLI